MSIAAVRPVLRTFLWTRALVWGMALVAAATATPVRLHDFWGRWDGGWYTTIAEHGYGTVNGDAAFYPLYPALVGALGRLWGDYVLAGVAVSLLATLATFILLYRLALEIGIAHERAVLSVTYLALFPTALFLSAVYSEALFLALALAAFLLAERGRWPAAGLAAGLALLTRPVGVAVVAGLLVLAWRAAPRRRALASLAIAPAVFGLYPLLLGLQTGEPLRFLRAEDVWQRHLATLGPLEGAWNGARAAWLGLARIVAPPQSGGWYWHHEETARTSFTNVAAFASLVVFGGLAVIAWRKFGAAYGVYCLSGLAIMTAAPTPMYPLLSLPRLGIVLFPVFFALASLPLSRRGHIVLLCLSALLLGAALLDWSRGHWVA